MTVPKLPKLPELSADHLPRVALAGVALALAALLIGGFAAVRVVVLSGTKADKAVAVSEQASQQSQQARSDTLAVVCAAVDAQRSGNPRRPPASSPLAVYSGQAWQAVYVRAGCERFTPEQLDAAIRAALTAQPHPTPTPTPSP